MATAALTVKDCYELTTAVGVAGIRVMYREPDVYMVTDVWVPVGARQMGYGRMLMERLLEDADFYGITLTLHAVAQPHYGGLYQDDLTAWYERCGFVHEGPCGNFYRRLPNG